MAHLLVSSYCPACDKKAEAAEKFAGVKKPVPPNEWTCVSPAAAAQPGAFSVVDSDLWWKSEQVSFQLTRVGAGAVIAWAVTSIRGVLMAQVERLYGDYRGHEVRIDQIGGLPVGIDSLIAPGVTVSVRL